MKLLVITSLKEHQKAVSGILTKSDIRVFSVTETIGFKDHQRANLLDDWFSSGGDYFNSIVVFAFTPDAKASTAFEEVKSHNEKNDTGFPIRAFILSVDQSTFIEKL
jgi:hypothetical protein